MADDVKVVQLDQQSLTALFRRLIHSSAGAEPAQTESASTQPVLNSSQIPSSTQFNEVQSSSPHGEASPSSSTQQIDPGTESEASSIVVPALVDLHRNADPGVAPVAAVSKGDNATIQKEVITSGGVAKDEHRWRKYGQKNMKGADFPRSYFKCSVKDCPAKKYCEQFIDKDGSAKFRTVYVDYHVHQAFEVERVAVQTAADFLGLVSSNFESLRHSSQSPSAPQSLTSQSKEQNHADSSLDAKGAVSSDSASNPPKTRKGGQAAPRPSRQPSSDRLVVQLDRLIDPNSDGFQWRKYGRKSIKGSDVPRQYFRCSFADCPVKKQVEPHSDGSHTVTYESFHSHEIPVLAFPQRSPKGAPGSVAEPPSTVTQTSEDYNQPQKPKFDKEGGTSIKRGRSSFDAPDLPISPAKKPKLNQPQQQQHADSHVPSFAAPQVMHSTALLHEDRDASIVPSRGILAALMQSLQNPDVNDVVQQFSEYSNSWKEDQRSPAML